MERTEKWCSGLLEVGDGKTRCKHGHFGPGMQVCRGIRYLSAASLAPCEREDLRFDEARNCVRGDMSPNPKLSRARSASD